MECTRQAVVFSKPNCPACVRAKALLTLKNVCYEEKIIGVDVSLDDLYAAVGHQARAVPQIVLDGTVFSTIQSLQQELE